MINLLLFFAVLFIIYKYVEFAYSFWKRKGIKGPEPTFLLGNNFSAFLQTDHITNIHDRLYKEYKSIGHSVVGMYRFLTPHLLILKPEIVREVLVKNFKNFHNNGLESTIDERADPLFSFNPFFLTGEAWKEKRNELTPGFSPARLKAMYPYIESVCDKLVKYLELKGTATLEGRDLSSRYTTNVVTNCVFAADAKAFEEEEPQIRDHVKNIFGAGSLVMVKYFFKLIVPSLLSALRIGFVPKKTETFFKDLMSQAIKYRRDNNVQSQDYLDFLLQMQKKKGLSDLEVAASGITFLNDGLETSSVAIAHILYELAENKDVQDRLRDEINEAINNGKLDYDTLMNLPYLDQVFSESLRLHPPVGWLGRECTESIELDIDKDKKLFVEKGTVLQIPIYSIHNDPEIYEEPEKFKPERFDNGVIKEHKDKGEWLVFGGGPRICLGFRFAITQIKACIATIVKNFEISVNSKTKTPLKLDPKEFLDIADGGIWLNFKKIKN